ncbi:ParB N-terminal domain-containing protein [Cellulomonas sp. C5510]|uniref:ParB/RepB/Spo0J family partition protein n=1 Tax=Cellulomonas sp. C5510 TaxID=2871170 RepID=UPI001C95D39E|nr:ParB N-terminal domain-containing protein [Cellulomonas sp. C5510]QZN87088.1 ParB N-terminal domain-containing protein [Cellulomonas sp. C5510]
MSTTTEAPVYEVGRVYEVAPGDLRIGTNVRKDTRPDAKDFAASVRSRGVIVAIDAHVDEAGGLSVLRGQRRALVAAQVGTPSGTVPVRVVAAPDEADRITDQLVENLHRADMHEREAREGVEQLALLGVSVAQIVKRTALPRPVVDAALSVAGHQASKDRMDAQGMTLDQAAIFAEFEDDPDAVATLESAWENRWERPRLAHIAQRLRDERDERTALLAEVERLRAEGLPVLDPADVTPAVRRLAFEDLRDKDGQPVPVEQWASTPGAGVVVTVDWQEDDEDEDSDDEDGDREPAEPRKVFVPVWVCTDPSSAGLHHRWDGPPPSDTLPADDDERAAREQAEQARREAESAERRRVLANNAAWRSAEVVRRQWLVGLLTRRQVPKGAEALIARALLERQHSLSHALSNGHELLGDLLGLRTEHRALFPSQAAARALTQATTPAAATVRTLAVVLAAWEARSGVHTWRNPGPYDAAIMAALVGWGYPASEVEQILTTPDEDDQEPERQESSDAADETAVVAAD